MFTWLVCSDVFNLTFNYVHFTPCATDWCFHLSKEQTNKNSQLFVLNIFRKMFWSLMTEIGLHEGDNESLSGGVTVPRTSQTCNPRNSVWAATDREKKSRDVLLKGSVTESWSASWWRRHQSYCEGAKCSPPAIDVTAYRSRTAHVQGHFDANGIFFLQWWTLMYPLRTVPAGAQHLLCF